MANWKRESWQAEGMWTVHERVSLSLSYLIY
jgi:hypothetical protein